VQKVDLDSALSPWVHHAANDEVAPVVNSLLEELVKEHKSIKDFTVFAPSNRVSYSAPLRVLCLTSCFLQAFLFVRFSHYVAFY